MKSVGILGASSILGESLLTEPFLKHSISFNLFQHQTSLSQFSRSYSVYNDIVTFLHDSDLIISLIPIWKFVDILDSSRSDAIKIQKVVALSSTSALTKSESSDLWEREYAFRFLESEKKLIELCKVLSIELVILRPTMIWGSCRDLNVTFIQRFISRFGFFVLPSRGNGLRWPIHHLDLFSIVYHVLHTDYSGVFIVRGREELSYREMVLKVFSWHSLDPVLFTVPPFLLSLCAYSARLITSKPYINSASFKRIDATESHIVEAPNCLLSEGNFELRSTSDIIIPSLFSRLANYVLARLLLTQFRARPKL